MMPLLVSLNLCLIKSITVSNSHSHPQHQQQHQHLQASSRLNVTNANNTVNNIMSTPPHTPMSINQLSIAEVFIAADMKMMRMLIGCQPSAACFCPMCLVTHDDALPVLIHALRFDSIVFTRFFPAQPSHKMIITMHSQHTDIITFPKPCCMAM